MEQHAFMSPKDEQGRCGDAHDEELRGKPCMICTADKRKY